MLTFDERITNIEISLTNTMNQYNKAATDGTLDPTDDEIGAVIDQIFDELKRIRDLYNVLKKQLKLVDDFINTATRK